ncbi:MAG: hypothetical protein KHY01_09250 [Firmicutes bacterium]|nr:hypothetical protein [Bacillota bacterium]
MKKIKLPVAWIIFLAAVCALAATVLQSARKAEQEFPMAGKNVSQLDTEQIISHVKKTQKCRKNMDLYVNGDNFDLQLTADFDLTDGGAVRFFYPDGKTTYSAQLRIFSDSGKFFVTQRSEWTQQQTQYQLADYLDALKYLPQAEIRAHFPDAEGFYISLTEEGTPENYEDALTYRASGAGEISGWQIHLALTPRQEHLQMGEEAASAQEAKTLHLFYENGN